MKKTAFASPQDAEAAFYEAIEHADLEAMMAVWADDEEIVCVHPGGVRMVGHEQVRESWAAIFRSGGQPRFHLSAQLQIAGMMIAVHSLIETVHAPGGTSRASALATNVFQRGPGGWRMIVHHATPTEAAPPPASEAQAKMLH